MRNKLRAIIVGASGYIGESLLAKASENFESYGTSTSGIDGHLILRLDSPEKFDYELIQPSDVIFLTAAISAPDICAHEYTQAYAVNVDGTSEFISKILDRGARVVFFSSDTVYGERNDEFNEQAACYPVGEYAEMKHMVEMRFLSNPLFKTIRLSYVFSREDKFTKYLTTCVKQNKEAKIFDPFYRAVIHRDDVIDGVIALSQRWDEFPQSVFNFGGPNVLARVEFTKILQDKAMTNLCFRVTEPGTDFFKSRPRVIRMASPILALLLDRPVHTLYESVLIEFNLKE